MTRPLGVNQKSVLRSLHEHGSWYASFGSGWVWENDSETIRILNTLEKRNLVMRQRTTMNGIDRLLWVLTSKGREECIDSVSW